MYNNTRERNLRKYEEKSELKVSLVIYGQPGGQNVFFFLSEVKEGSIINCWKFQLSRPSVAPTVI